MTEHVQDEQTYSITVYGRVQGVGYRYFVLQRARMLKIRGWVRNNRDASVEILCRGTSSKLQDFLALCKQGPSYAHVERIEESLQDRNREDLTSFEIKY